PVQSDAEVRQPFISRAGIIFIPTTYYHNSWWLAHLSPSFRDFFDAVPKNVRFSLKYQFFLQENWYFFVDH
ncbi:MAG: hypothetical protein IJY53_06925, partial [Akkermansia sp.]|nr:hypothetical protein [Akkermansia sp.]